MTFIGPGLKISDRRVIPDFFRNIFNNEDIELTFDYDNINSKLFDVGLFCMKQEAKVRHFPNLDSFILEKS